jgi:hypothetical protein
MKRSIILIYLIVVIALIAGCGSGGGGGSERFSTVEVFASYESDAYTADAFNEEDTSVPADGICDTFGLEDDDAIATVTVSAYDPLPEGVSPSAVNILRYIVEYIPQTPATPDLSAKRINHQFSITAPPANGSTVAEVPIRLFDVSDKAYINSTFGIGEWKWSAKVSLRMEEVSTNIGETIEFKFPVRYFNVAEDTPCTF